MKTATAIHRIRQYVPASPRRRRGQYTFQLGDSTLALFEDAGRVSGITTAKEGRVTRHRSVAEALRVSLHRGRLLVNPGGTSDLLLAVGIQRVGPALVPSSYALAIVLAPDREPGDDIPGTSFDSAEPADVGFVERFLAGDVDEHVLLRWLREHAGGEMAELLENAS